MGRYSSSCGQVKPAPAGRLLVEADEFPPGRRGGVNQDGCAVAGGAAIRAGVGDDAVGRHGVRAALVRDGHVIGGVVVYDDHLAVPQRAAVEAAYGEAGMKLLFAFLPWPAFPWLSGCIFRILLYYLT